MDAILSSLTPDQIVHVEDVLSNDDSSSEEELLHFFQTIGLTEAQAQQALTYRTQYLCNIFLDGRAPILMGEQALRFNPHRRQFEPV
jgi:hypothetical protein